jgi:hypothetical protein
LKRNALLSSSPPFNSTTFAGLLPSASIAGSRTSAIVAPTWTLSKLTYADPPELPVLKRSYSITWTSDSFARSMIVPPEPVSMLVSTMTPAPAAIACSAWDCCVAASPSALTMVCSIPASVNALSK